MALDLWVEATRADEFRHRKESAEFELHIAECRERDWRVKHSELEKEFQLQKRLWERERDELWGQISRWYHDCADAKQKAHDAENLVMYREADIDQVARALRFRAEAMRTLTGMTALELADETERLALWIERSPARWG